MTDTSPRQRSARGEGDRLRQDLLDAAVELMATHGSIESISLRGVARQAGVSPTAVYRHFDDRLTLLRESVEYCWANFRDVILRGNQSSADPYVALRTSGQMYVDYATQQRGQYRVLFSNQIDVGLTTTDAGNEAFDTLIRLVTRVLESRDDQREPYFVAIQVHSWIHGIVELCGNHPDVPWPATDDLLDGLVEALRLTDPKA